ncbi:hypothetical protein Droror1_Dr00019749 [Drosera rotundifolia]
MHPATAIELGKSWKVERWETLAAYPLQRRRRPGEETTAPLPSQLIPDTVATSATLSTKSAAAGQKAKQLAAAQKEEPHRRSCLAFSTTSGCDDRRSIRRGSGS